MDVRFGSDVGRLGAILEGMFAVSGTFASPFRTALIKIVQQVLHDKTGLFVPSNLGCWRQMSLDIVLAS